MEKYEVFAYLSRLILNDMDALLSHRRFDESHRLLSSFVRNSFQIPSCANPPVRDLFIHLKQLHDDHPTLNEWMVEICSIAIRQLNSLSNVRDESKEDKAKETPVEHGKNWQDHVDYQRYGRQSAELKIPLWVHINLLGYYRFSRTENTRFIEQCLAQWNWQQALRMG